MKLKIFFLALLCVNFSQPTYAQKTLISRDEYNSAVQKAEKASNIFPEKYIGKETLYENEKIYKTIDFLGEAVSAENYRFVRTETIKDKIKKYEEIHIGLVIYKRENDGEWKKEERRFNDGISDGLSKEDVVFFHCLEYSKETENQDAVHYHYFQIGEDRGGLNYEEEIYSINEAGRIFKKETFKGQLNPRSVKWHQVFTYYYNPNIKIEAPIK